MAQTAADHLDSLVNFLSDPLVSSLFASHPNDLGTASFQPPGEWDSWWSWAAGGTHSEEDSDGGELWTRLIQYYDFCRSSDTSASATMVDEIERLPVPFQGIPPSLRSLIGTASHLAVKREPGHVIYPPSSDDMSQLHVRQKDRPGDGMHSVSANALRGMSPKKAHEVVQMSSFIGELLGNCSALSDVDHVVDVGAGQGYLSRALRDELGLHVLALDYSDIQTQGAAKRDTPTKQKRRAAPGGSEESTSISRQTGHHADTGRSQDGNEEVKTQRGSLTYVTAKIDADTLRQSTRAWVESDGTVVDRRPSEEQTGRGPKPVLFVALHACGSLTPDILRAFAGQPSAKVCWTPRAAVVVGCCYNMLRAEDFPLSHALRSRVALNPNHLQLAAQLPAQWMRSEDTLRDARLALRKVVWRALIQDVLQPPHPNPSSGDPGSGSAEAAGKQRLGRLNDSAYADWETFADRVRTRLGMREGSLVRADRATERRIEVFHTLRCIVGPVIESLIMLDRAVWLEEELQGTGFRVELVNLFDQASGSGRNVAVVILPDDRTRW
ncbi:hypothetical protein PYCCODRAFT_1435416 [Trametes coccinea BRFM310]|uniref:Methyltransferase domain-containing protein n=1 Tax=Trametes coccinea (strain BRFM310) TaxID=1353009 RepID=A0A1Y2IMS6_TRAC3|nr:hypothetical protein PYCCODRAFT_1435416 [Trametes coccinea BRFM310]